MVERLKEAIEKARRQRGEALAPQGMAAPAAAEPSAGVGDAWSRLPEAAISSEALKRARIVSADKSDPAYMPVDVMRTRIVHACREHGWTRVAVTSPDKWCGKSFVSLNLAFSIARNPNFRSVVLDLDLRSPSFVRTLNLSPSDSIERFLVGDATVEDIFRRISDNLAIGLAGRPVKDSAELLQSQIAAETLARLQTDLTPTIMIYDLSPFFVADDVLGFLGNVDALVLVAAAGQTRAADIRECERLISGATNFLGVVLNKVEQADLDGYGVAYEPQLVSD